MKLATLLKATAFSLLLTLTLSTSGVFAEDNINSEESVTQSEEDENNDCE